MAVDFARVFYHSIIVSNCARNGALYGSATPSQALNTAGIEAEALKDAVNLDQASVKVSSTTDSTTNPTYVEVTVTSPFETVTGFLGIPSQIDITWTTRMEVTPLLPN